MSEPIHDLAAPYALDALDDDERHRFEAHLADCAVCRAEVVELQRGIEALADATATPPPSRLKASVMAAIDDEPQERFAAAPAPTWRERLRPLFSSMSWRIGSAAAAAAVVVLAVAIALTLRDGALGPDDVIAAPDAVTVTLPATEAYTGTVEAGVAYSPGRTAAVVTFDGLAGVDGDRTYQLWVIDGDGPTPAGLFVPGDGGRATVLLDAPVRPGDTIGVTVEPSGGSPAPTGEVLFAATV